MAKHDRSPTAAASRIERWLDGGWLPDAGVRAGIRNRLRQRLRRELAGSVDQQCDRHRQLVAELRSSPIAISTGDANRQHYEVPAEFFRICLGPRLKYSCCYWPTGVHDLRTAEESMLAMTCERADIRDGQDILELGCGWGSLTLWLAENYPASRVTAISNSRSQKIFIDAEAKRRGVRPPEVITADINDFAPDRRFDRVMSVEMLEHVRNHRLLLDRVSTWLNTRGRIFVHVFTNRRVAYLFREDDWIGRHFFTGGVMPSDDLLLTASNEVHVLDHWRVDGQHYAKTARAWLSNLDSDAPSALKALESVHGSIAPAWLNRWRVFFMACEELWGFDAGREWLVSHYLFEKH